MHECLLCKRDMKKSTEIFGHGCIKNIYFFLNIPMPKKLNKRENNLYKEITKICKINNPLNKENKIWLTDRYLTLQYLEKNPYGNFNKIKQHLNLDISNINNITEFNKLKTSTKISLKQSYDLYKKAIKFSNNIELLKVSDWKDLDNIKLLLSNISFIFHMKKNQNQYEKNSFKAMQFAFWQLVVEVARKDFGFNISADFLQHSLEEKPLDLYFTEGNIIETIKKDRYFQEKLKIIIEDIGKNKNEFEYDSTNDNFSPEEKEKYTLIFEDKDLYFSIHASDLKISGTKNNSTWNLQIHLHDKYDYSEFKDLEKYYKDTNSMIKSILSSSLYNLAAVSNACGVMKIYEVYIDFTLSQKEVM